MKTKLLIFPFNGNGIEALDCLSDQFECVGFVDDTMEKQGKHDEFGIEVFNRQAFERYKDALILAVPGSSVSYSFRNKIIESLKVPLTRFARVIHPSASVSSYTELGYNILIMENVVIKATAWIGNHVCILPCSVIHHDSKVFDYTLLGAHVTIAGNTIIGKQCYIGSGTTVINNITIGEKTLVGMGSNVLKDVPDNSKIAGNPAAAI
jgi:sugar O-acyltransferase (sialic acid O-acetyltransferase NeuD family)